MQPYCNFYIARKILLGYINCKGKNKEVRGETSGSREKDVIRKETEGKHQGRRREQKKKEHRTSNRKKKKMKEKLLSLRQEVCFFLVDSSSHSQSL